MSWQDKFRRLEKGWNSYRAVPIEEKAIQFASILTEMAPQIVPTTGGGIQLEWHCEGLDIELEISPDGSMNIWNSEMKD
jgi:hypothetical protein